MKQRRDYVTSTNCAVSLTALMSLLEGYLTEDERVIVNRVFAYLTDHFDDLIKQKERSAAE